MRINDLDFGILLNIDVDHLDYHGNLEAYKKAKESSLMLYKNVDKTLLQLTKMGLKIAKILSKSFMDNAYVTYIVPLAVGIFVSGIATFAYKGEITRHFTTKNSFIVYYIIISAVCILSLYGIEISGHSYIFGEIIYK